MAGMCLTSIGAGLYAGGLISIWFSYVAGISMFSIGSASLCAGIPCLIVGSVRKNHSYQIYNEQCAKRVAAQTPITFGVNMYGNGIGLAMNF